MRIVLDTNVFISGIFFTGPPDQILKAWRVARLLAILMALQAGLPPLDFGGIKGRRRQEYFAAVQAGLDRDYHPMERVFSAVIRRTQRIHEI